MKRIFLFSMTFFYRINCKDSKIRIFIQQKKLSQNWKFELWMHSLSVTPN